MPPPFICRVDERALACVSNRDEIMLFATAISTNDAGGNVLSPILSVIDAAVGVLFLYAGLLKLTSLPEFIHSLLLIPHFPYRARRVVGITVPLLEIVGGAFAVMGVMPAKLLLIGLLVVFAQVTVVAIRRGQKVTCNCFGADNEHLSAATLVRNAVLVSLLVATTLLHVEVPSILTTLYGTTVCALFLCVTSTLRNRRDLEGFLNPRAS
jgi:putative oxidoreductase